MELKNSGIYGKFLDYKIAGEKWNALNLALTTVVQKPYGSESRRLHR